MLSASKLIIIGLSVALVAFTISTIVLAVQKGQLNNELHDVRDKMHLLEEELIQKTTSAPNTIITMTTTPAQDITTLPAEIVNYRLSRSVIPSSYDLYLHPHIDTGTFTGQEIIVVDTLTDTSFVELHSLNLEIESVYLQDPPTATILVKGYSFDLVRELLVIELTETVPAGKTFGIGILFNGKMQGKIVGLYSSSYLKENGSKKVIATSKFEPTYARQAFPCFDEPDMKANFKITLVHPTEGSYHALSNMNVEKSVNQGNFTEVYFQTSVPMSTYLACFIVSDFDSKQETVDTKGIGEPFTISVYATSEQINKVEFALDVGKAVIEYFINYFQIAYPLPKLDMAAIPDFVSGAMEHWGLVTYRETSLLFEEGVSSSINKQRVATVIAHEFAHMWFGNLVTMKWWNDLWLNEGFATYIEFKGTSSKFPEWKMEDQFLIAELHDVLVIDALTSSHPIVQTVSTPDQITEIFDTITYNKGASIIRMLEDILGAENFRTSVTNYLNTNKYKNAVTADLLNEVDKLNLGIDITAIMRTWTEQKGFPVVEVTKISNNEFKLTQKRFLSNPDEYDLTDESSPFNYKWSIPISYFTDVNSQIQYQWLYYDQNEITITLSSAVEWIKFNHDQVGYYRVNYPQDMWEYLANNLVANPNVFKVADRAHLLNDAFALADSTQLSYDIALDMTRYLRKESDYVPWSVAATKLVSLKNTLLFTNSYVNYTNYSRKLINPIYEQVTWSVGSDHLQNRLRVTILNAACSLGLENCLAEAADRFKTWLDNPNFRPHPDIRDTVYYYGMMEVGNENIWQKMWNLFISETDASEKSKLMSGLSSVQIPWILQRFINLAWNEEYVRGQDYFSCLSSIAANPIGKPLVWDYVREHWLDLVDRFGLNERYLGNLIPTITARFNTQTKLEEMEAFFAKYPNAGAGAGARVRALATVRYNIAWLQNNRDKVDNWLYAQQ